jgi:primosomal protein N' (replication factor Y)
MQADLFIDPSPEAPPQTGLFADVVFDRPVDQAFTYLVPEELRPSVAIGKRVRAPFGRGAGKAVVGYCVGLSESAPGRKVKPLLAVLDEEALLLPSLLRLTRWMADYYHCAWGQVLNAIIPAGARHGAGSVRRLFVELDPDAKPVKLTPRQEAVAAFVREQGKPVDARLVLRQAGASPGILRALLQRGVLRRVTRRVDRDLAPAEGEDTGPLTLSGEQAQAVASITSAVEAGGFKPFLLYGVTGSGKTEVYLRAIEEVARRGKQALVLVPEISLTPQTVRRFAGRFGDVAVLHSSLGDAERGVQWRRVLTGQARVVVGARSAVFAPLRSLGLIVIDEEHEATFKQDTTPRYHGRDVAVMRARIEDVPILLGSATPSLESWANARRGQYQLLTLSSRAASRPLPPVRLIDLRHQPSPKGRPSALSEPLLEAMRRALADGGQVMLLLNRRGFATHVHCPACGHVETCRFCDLALTYHKQRDLLVCHYCGFEREPALSCPACGQSAIRYQGLGTEKLEADLQQRFPGHVIRRMDSDTMRKPGSHARTLGAFRKGEVHILLGTQMIAKGLDFPNVTLVGVVNADMSLHIPDFRSAERTFQLISQVSGRAGRGPRGGVVLVQTFNPEHPAIRHAASHDYTAFVAGEMAHREAHGYPPYSRLARVIVRGPDEEAVRAFAESLATLFRAAVEKDAEGAVRLLGPAEAPVYRLQGNYRYHFQLQSAGAKALHVVLRAVIPALSPPAGVELTLDVDPFSMM